MDDHTVLLSTLLSRCPTAGLLKTPAPIHELSRLSSWAGRRLFVLRDDLTGFALGGNKTRKLDYLIGDALARKADTLVTSGATSFSRNAAAAGRVWSLDVHVVLPGRAVDQNELSQAVFEQFDTTLHYAPDESSVALACARVAESLRAQGRVVYELHPGGSDAVGALGYSQAFLEIERFSRSTGIHFDSIVHATGSAGTQAGLSLGQAITGYRTRILGIAVSRRVDAQTRSAQIRELASAAAHALEAPWAGCNPVVDDRFIGPGYAIPSEEGAEALKAFAVMEGISLDPAYTAKAAAGMLHYARGGVPELGACALFIHTGGNAGLFY